MFKLLCACLFLLPAVVAAAADVRAGEAPAAPAPDASNVARQRAQLKAERDRIEARFAAEQANCRQQFAVTACTDEVRLRRRAALAAPRARGLALDDQQRAERTRERREAVAQKQRRAAERPVPAAVPAPPPGAAQEPIAPAVGAAAPPIPALASSAVAVPRSPAPTAAGVTGSATAAQRAKAFRLRQTQIQQGQARIEARQAERARNHKPSVPLPVPSGASGPRP